MLSNLTIMNSRISCGDFLSIYLDEYHSRHVKPPTVGDSTKYLAFLTALPTYRVHEEIKYHFLTSEDDLSPPLRRGFLVVSLLGLVRYR